MTQTRNQLNGTRFGCIDFNAEDVIFFPRGLIGLSTLQHFIVVCLDERTPFRWLQSCEEPGFALLVTKPEIYFKDYSPTFSPLHLEDLKVGTETQKLVFTTATIPPGRPQDMTLNLRGPIVINTENRLATQCILDDETYTTKHRVFTQSEDGNVVAA